MHWLISFIFETISVRDANFGLPDFGAFLMDSSQIHFFPAPNCVIRHARRSLSSRKFSHKVLQRTTNDERASM